MSDIETAALRLGLLTLAFLAVALAIVWFRRRGSAAPTPQASRDTPPAEEVQVAPSRLARISREAEIARVDAAAREGPLVDRPAPPPAPALEPAEPSPVEAVHDPMPPEIDAPDLDAPAWRGGPAAVRLVPRIPPRGAAPVRSWLGGRPRLPADMEWPKIDGREGDFLAQIACADLPPDLWDGLTPRSGSILLFASSDNGAPMALHVPEDGPPRDPPRAAGILWPGPGGDLAPLARRAFPEWPVDIVAAGPEAEAEAEAEAAQAADGLPLDADGYDIADPAFHPFDWDSMLALAAILDKRLPADPAETNREAWLHAREIVAIIRDSADEAPFSADDAMAVMAGLAAIRWTGVTAAPDPETGEERVETQSLPLTRHLSDADWWVGDYRRLLSDHARQLWCTDPERLPAPTRALFEPEWRAMAAREAAASMGGRPDRALPGFDDERDALLFTLPASTLMSRALPGGRAMHVAIRKADLAMVDFSRARLLAD